MTIIQTSISIVWKNAKWMFIVAIATSVLLSLLLVLMTYATQFFFDTTLAALKGDATLTYLIFVAIAIGVIEIVQKVISSLSNFVFDELQTIAEGGAGYLIHKKASSIEPISYENPEFLDDINRANEGARNCFNLFNAYLSFISFYIPYFLTIGIYLYTLKPILVVSLLFIFVPLFINNYLRAKVFTDLEDDAGALRRSYEYYERCIVDSEYFKETRILGAFSYFYKLYQASLQALNKKLWRVEVRGDLIELGMYLLTLLGYLGVLYLLLISLISGDISVGAFAAVFTSIAVAVSLANEMINVKMRRTASKLPTVINFINFLAIPERSGEFMNLCPADGVVLNNISFRYPGTAKNAIDHVSLTIHKEETIAIVGENGSGKSTLTKLILGMYTPDSGEIMINGKNVATVSPSSTYLGVTAVFQKFQRYKFSLENNISISDIDRDVTSEHLSQAVRNADVDIDSSSLFPEGYDTILSKEFDGVDLSGGQWQRVAIARGFYRHKNFIVLDEPTAAIDPIEETKLYQKFAEVAQNNTAIIVTHRLGSAKIADRIIVMDNGKIVEEGTHDSLMKMGKKYAEMYTAQAKWYENNSSMM
ncbi:ATP-binding cassette domain-containing protein [Paenibacillus baekrokdamisoli]|nr:ABC transporter ATP-binding protein [Paenibacillus baekrokdamisoli]